MSVRLKFRAYRSLAVGGLIATSLLANACGGGSAQQKPDPAPTSDTSEEKPVAAKPKGLSYPQARMDDVVDDYHGKAVKDPYRWLEEPASAETQEWVAKQNQLTFKWLKEVESREAFEARLNELWNYERYGVPYWKGKGKKRQYFYSKNDGLQNQAVLYRLKTLDGEPKVLIDPNTLSRDGTTALGATAISKDGKKIAYALQKSGSDWMEWHVRDVDSGEDLKDVIEWSKFAGASWTHDGKGFFYARYPEPEKGDEHESANYNHKIYYHRIGTPQSADQLVAEDKDDKEHGFDAHVTDDGKYVVIHVWKGTDRRNRIWVMKIGNMKLPKRTPKVTKLLNDFDAAYTFVGNNGSTFYFQTDLDAPRGKLIAVDLKKPDRKNWKTIIEQGEDKLESVRMIGKGFLVQWLHSAHQRVSFHKMSGAKVRDIDLPTIGSAGGFYGEPDDMETFYAFTSFTYPTTIFHLDLKTGESKPYRQPKVAFEPSAFETKQVTVKSKDGTEVPMFVVHQKGLELNGTNPTLLYGYGGFNIPLTPGFKPELVAWLERGGVYAMPNLRGGGEFGEDWHRAGMLENKQNVFDDFAAAAKYLVAQKYTSKDKLGISGRSNGGLLVGASITQNPDLFGAAIAGVGVLDMLRYHRFTIGHAWVSEYGSAEEAEQFPFLFAYSPLHNAKPANYPPLLITTASTDDRVVPAHSYKFAATMQKAQQGEAPILIRIETKAGHGAGKPVAKVIEEKADEFSFLWRALGMDSSGKDEASKAAEGGAGAEAGAASAK